MTQRRTVTEQAATAAIEQGCRMLRLPTIRDRFSEIAAAAEREQMSYLGFLSELVIAECDDRTHRRAQRRVRDAGFPRPKRLEEFSFDANPAINPAVIGQLATCAWVKAGNPLCLIGDSGTGKTHLLIALGALAAEAGHRVRYTLASKLVNELVEAADDKQLTKLINHYGRVDLILVDELGYLQLDRRGAELLFQVLTEREERAAIAIASNEPFFLDKDIHRPATVCRHRRQIDVRRADHRNRQQLLPTRPSPQDPLSRRGQFEPSRRGQFKLTLRSSRAAMTFELCLLSNRPGLHVDDCLDTSSRARNATTTGAVPAAHFVARRCDMWHA